MREGEGKGRVRGVDVGVRYMVEVSVKSLGAGAVGRWNGAGLLQFVWLVPPREQ